MGTVRKCHFVCLGAGDNKTTVTLIRKHPPSNPPTPPPSSTILSFFLFLKPPKSHIINTCQVVYETQINWYLQAHTYMTRKTCRITDTHLCCFCYRPILITGKSSLLQLSAWLSPSHDLKATTDCRALTMWLWYFTWYTKIFQTFLWGVHSPVA